MELGETSAGDVCVYGKICDGDDSTSEGVDSRGEETSARESVFGI